MINSYLQHPETAPTQEILHISPTLNSKVNIYDKRVNKDQPRWGLNSKYSNLFNPNVHSQGQNLYYQDPRAIPNPYTPTRKFEEDLKGKNSSIFAKDNVIGRTLFSSSGRPIVIKDNDKVKIPQIMYENDIMINKDWQHLEYDEIDEKNNLLSAMKYFNKHNTNLTPEGYKPQIKHPKPIISKMPKEEFSRLDNNIRIINNTLEHFSEKFETGKTTNSYQETDNLYGSILRAYAVAINHFLNNNPNYSKWSENWKNLDKSLKKTDLKIGRLDSDDEDVAYTENKGEIIKFRWRDNSGYVEKSVFTYVLLHELTHQVFPSSFIGHDSPFPEMLCLLCVAGLELQLFDLNKLPQSLRLSNGQPITSHSSIKEEILIGIEMLKIANENNKDAVEYYDALSNYVNRH